MVILILFLIGQNGDRDYLCLLVRPLFYSEYSGFKFKFTGFERVCVCVCVCVCTGCFRRLEVSIRKVLRPAT